MPGRKSLGILIVWLLLGLMTVPALRAQERGEASSPSASLAAALDQVLERARAENRLVGAVVLVARDGRVVYHRAVGQAGRMRRWSEDGLVHQEVGIPMTEENIFRLSSVSKPFTVMAAAVLIQQGRLGLDDPVSKWLPEFRPKLPDGRPAVITVRQLMSHTAGLDYGFAQGPDGPYRKAGISDGLDEASISLEENVRRRASAPLLYEPGTSWRYSLATDVLGAVVAAAHGASLPRAMADLVFNPLGLRDTGFAVIDPERARREGLETRGFVSADRGRLATPYYQPPIRGKKPKPGDGLGPEPLPLGQGQAVEMGGASLIFFPDRALDPRAWPSGGAGLVGTAPDVLSLLETIRRGGAPLVGPELMATLNQDQLKENLAGSGQGFALGWAVLTDPAAANSPQSVGALSWGGVYGHSWFIDPAEKLTVVIMTNTTPEGLVGPLVGEITQAVYHNLPPKN